MKKMSKMFFKYSWLFIAAMVIFIACDKDDPDPDPQEPVEDGFYIKGEVTPFNNLELNGMMVSGINEVGQEVRSGMYEKYITINSGAAGFNIVQVAGATHTEWGPATSENIETAGEREQPNITIQQGTIGTSGVFTVPETGLYHVIVDTQTGKFVIAPVPYWAIIGNFSGWSDSQMPMTGGFNLNELNFTAEGIELRAGEFKFRYGGGWKLEIDGEDVKVNTNYGGVVSGTLPNLTTTLVPGGANYSISAEQQGIYTVNMKWTVADGFVSSLTKTGDVEEQNYPEELYMIGASVGGWDWGTVDLPMVPVHSQPHLFWKIVWIETGVEDAGYKFAPEKGWGNDFGYDGNDPVNGIYQRGGTNMPEPDASGYYMVVVNLKTNEIAVVDPQVYLIGNTVGTWEMNEITDNELFAVDNDNQVVTITRDLVDGDLRMYAWFDAVDEWFSAWWQSEFMIFDGVIEFRGTGGDQASVPATAGEYTIELDFKNNTGTITKY
jgi:hypothetical protein